MLRRLRENGPALLVPLAWTFVTAVHLELASEHALFVSHLVMATIIAGFTILSWSEMAEGVALLWRRVLVVGFVITVLGVVGFFVDALSGPLFATSVVGWMVVPAVALLGTGRHVDRAPAVYLAGGGLSLVGALAYLVGISVFAGEDAAILGLTLVTIGQTVGILNAVYQH